MEITTLEEAFEFIKKLENEQEKIVNEKDIEISRLNGGIKNLEERIQNKDGIIKDLKDVIDVFKPKGNQGKKQEDKEIK